MAEGVYYGYLRRLKEGEIPLDQETVEARMVLDNPPANHVYVALYNGEPIGIFTDFEEARAAVDAWVEEWIKSASPAWYKRWAHDWYVFGDRRATRELLQHVENGISGSSVRVEAMALGEIWKKPTEAQ